MDKKQKSKSCMEEPLHSLHRAVFSERERSDFSKSVFQAKWIKYLKYFIISAKHGRWHLHGDYIITLKTNHKVLRIYTDWKYLTSSSHWSEWLSYREAHGLKGHRRNAIRGEFHFSGSRLEFKSRVQSAPMFSHYHKHPKPRSLKPKQPLNSRIHFVESCTLLYETLNFSIQYFFEHQLHSAITSHFGYYLALVMFQYMFCINEFMNAWSYILINSLVF